MAETNIFNGLNIYGEVNINGEFTFPTTDGNAGQVLATDGGGTVSWINVSGGTGGSGNTLFATTVAITSGITETVTHNLGTQDVLVQLVDMNANEQIFGLIDDYQLNSISVTLNKTLADVRVLVIGSGVTGATGGPDIYVTGGTFSGGTILFTNNSGGTFTVTGITGGGTGSTSPAGSNTQVQFNNSGSFGANTGFTFNPLSGNVHTVQSTYGSSGGTNFNTKTFVGFESQSNVVGAGTLYTHSDAPNYVTFNAVGDLDNLGIDNNGVFLGNFNLFGGVVGFLGDTGTSRMRVYNDAASYEGDVKVDYEEIAITYTSGNTGTQIITNNGGVQVKLQPDSADTSGFFVRHEPNNLNLLSVDFSPQFDYSGITFFEQYTFPTTSGNTGDVLALSSGGVLQWSAATGGGSGSSIVIVGDGDFSTMRCGNSNTASGNYSTVLGYENTSTSSAPYGTIAGGTGSNVGASGAFIGGGNTNEIELGSDLSVIVGGNGNCITFSACNATIAGGYQNTMSGEYGVIGGGSNNVIISGACRSVIGGGGNNTASGYRSVIAGGFSNTTSAVAAFIGGGFINSASGYYSTVSGGYCNSASGRCATVGGGYCNSASDQDSTVAGGCQNTASGLYATVGGGYLNVASGTSSTVGGGQNNSANSNWTTIGGGNSNTVSGDYSGIFGGANNSITGYSKTFIVGSDITADRTCTTFVNNLSITNLQDGSGGLPSGAVYYCSGDSNRLYFVP